MEVHRGPQVIKSANDPRSYRAITLQNGVRALLIEDFSSYSESSSLLNLPEKDESVEEDVMEQGSQEDDGAADEQSSVALCIGVGSFSDPKEVPGLAHFLEHMVFMGSEKYPDENHFDAFLKESGGNSNAYTDCERTVFFFDVRRQHFKEALDIFAQFFTSPLMNEDSIDREIMSVDSEFDVSKPCDRTRLDQLLGTFAKKGNPMGKFMIGSLESLKTIPERNGIDLYEHLKVFHEEYYTAQYMTMAVQSRDSLDKLESWVTEIFSQVPNNGKEKISFYHHNEPFDTDRFYRVYKVVPTRNINHLEFTWSLPCLKGCYKKKPVFYLAWLIGYEGKGSILSYLKRRYWAVGLRCGNSDSGFEHNTTGALFVIDITLTELGMTHVSEVMYVVFEYLEMLKEVGPKHHIFHELQQIEEFEFRWKEQGDPVEYVDKLSVNMQNYPPEHIIIGDALIFEYDAELIENVLSYLLPDKANIMLSSKRFENFTNCVEPWYQTKYSSEAVPKKLLNAWSRIEPRVNLFYLPSRNEYIATSFDIKRPDLTDSLYPVAITNSKHSRLWYKRDNKFKVPKAHIHFHCISPIINMSPINACYQDLFIRALHHELHEEAYPAEMAHLSYEIGTFENSLIIKAQGFSDKLFKLFRTLVNNIADFEISEELFTIIKDEQEKAYYNSYIKPNELENCLRQQILRDKFWTNIDRQLFLRDATRCTLMQYIHTLKDKLFVEGLVMGNVTSQEARMIECYLLKKLDCKPLRENEFPSRRVVKLPTGQRYCRVQSLNPEDNNSIITNYYQHGQATIRDFCLIDLLVLRMEEPCFDALRTREQLGYSVYVVTRDNGGILAFSITVNSQIDKFSMQYVDDKIEDFLLEFEENLDNMNEDEFENVKGSLMGLKNCEDTHLAQEVKRNWNEIFTQYYVFDRQLKEVEALTSLSRDEFVDYYKSHIQGGRKWRKLSVQVMGHSDNLETSSDDSDSDSDSDSTEAGEATNIRMNLDVEPEEPCVRFLDVKAVCKKTVIFDPISFKQKSKLYPVSKINQTC